MGKKNTLRAVAFASALLVGMTGQLQAAATFENVTAAGEPDVKHDFDVATTEVVAAQDAQTGFVYATELFGSGSDTMQLPADSGGDPNKEYAAVVYTIGSMVDSLFDLTFTLSGGAVFTDDSILGVWDAGMTNANAAAKVNAASGVPADRRVPYDAADLTGVLSNGDVVEFAADCATAGIQGASGIVSAVTWDTTNTKGIIILTGGVGADIADDATICKATANADSGADVLGIVYKEKTFPNDGGDLSGVAANTVLRIGDKKSGVTGILDATATSTNSLVTLTQGLTATLANDADIWKRDFADNGDWIATEDNDTGDGTSTISFTMGAATTDKWLDEGDKLMLLYQIKKADSALGTSGGKIEMTVSLKAGGNDIQPEKTITIANSKPAYPTNSIDAIVGGSAKISVSEGNKKFSGTPATANGIDSPYLDESTVQIGVIKINRDTTANPQNSTGAAEYP